MASSLPHPLNILGLVADGCKIRRLLYEVL